VVDQQRAMVMSYNLHPRSERVEGEMVILVDDTEFSQQLTQVFEQDIQPSVAQEIHQMNEVEIPDSAVCLPSLRIFFDLL
jgi:phosphatidylserine/phosphatidylglycerophosphate/cardiolipin synthase-like enzyme